MILSPAEYSQVSPYELLEAAERGHVGLDHRWLKALLDRPEQSIPDLVRFALQHQRGDREDLTDDLIAIFHHLGDPRALPYLIQVTRRREDLSFPLIEAFRALGPPAVDALLKLYEEQKDDPNCEIGFLLAALAVPDPRILEALIARLEIDPVDAGHCLAAYRDPAAIPALEAAIARSDREQERASLQASLERLRQGEGEIEDEPFDIWADYPAEDEPRFGWMDEPEWRAFLSSPSPEYRAAAIGCLDEHGPERRDVDLLFGFAREDPDPRVRGRAWQALAGSDDREDIREAMRVRLAQEDAAIQDRAGALVALAFDEGERPEIQRWMIEFYQRPESRAAALQAMTVSGDPGFDRYFPPHLGDEDPAIQASAIQGVGLLEISSAAPALAALFEDDAVREDALTAYALSAEAQLSRRGMRQLLEKIERLAQGLSQEEDDQVKQAINYRLQRQELPAIFDEDGRWIEEAPAVAPKKVGRNDPCPCGSGKKYKKCCGAA
ncbi:MAG: HEAT repeat domain-containing protein [Candidatus Solibacter usitatus]|nr:HEAT repeat domain-containing protein [Candidatus Solibacter usitatus]